MFWIALVILIILLFIILLLLHITIQVHYCYDQETHELVIKLYLIKIRVFQRRINLKEHVQDEYLDLLDILQAEHQGFNLKHMKQMFENIVKELKLAKQLLFFVLRNLTFRQFDWKTHFGTGEASSTGVASGGVWMIKGTLLGTLSTHSNMNCQPKIAVIPYFQQRGIRSEIDCIVTIRLGKAIHTAMHLLRKISVNKEAYN
jgi:hypothetical protein